LYFYLLNCFCLFRYFLKEFVSIKLSFNFFTTFQLVCWFGVKLTKIGNNTESLSEALTGFLHNCVINYLVFEADRSLLEKLKMQLHQIWFIYIYCLQFVCFKYVTIYVFLILKPMGRVRYTISFYGS